MIGIGVDAVDIERFRRSLARTPSMRAAAVHRRCELAYVAPKADPVPSLAARFAAREAVMKALGLGLGAFGFHEVWVDRAESGEPSLRVTGQGARAGPAKPASPPGTCRSPTPTWSPSPTSSPRDVASSA